MEIMKLATQIGKLIKQDERVKRFEMADKAYDSDETLQKLVFEYNTQRTVLDEEYKKSTPDTLLTDTVEARIEEIYNSIMENAVFIEYNAAQEAVNALMREVNAEISFQVTGKRPCAPSDCSSCSSGCSHE